MKHRIARAAAGAALLLLLISERPLPAHAVVRTAAGTLCRIDRDRGFLVSNDGGGTWRERNEGLPDHVVYPFTESKPVPLTSIGVDPARQARVAVTTSSRIFISEDLGNSWREVPVDKPVKESAYFTSVALSPASRDKILLGTSFNGVYETRDSGISWTHLEDLSDPLYRGAGFYEEIRSLSYDFAGENSIILEVGFDDDIFTGNLETETLEKLPEPDLEPGERRLQLLSSRRGPVLFTDKRKLLYRESDEDWTAEPGGLPFLKNDISEASKNRLAAAADKHGIYLKSWNSSGEELEKHLKFLSDHGLNSLVIDMKDDNGRITYDTELELPYEIGSVSRHIDLEALVEAAEEAGIYLIGRIVCFQDPKLYAYKNNAYAVWDSQKNEPWANLIPVADEKTEEPAWIQREFWVDSFSELAWDYLISLAEELERRGIDEVQFDYIRFPSDGDLTHAVYRHRKPGMTKIDGLESFLRAARERITVPISTDLYGFNSWYRMGNWIGQNIEMVSRYVDVICPMYYPSHFPRDFLKDTPYLERAEYIYRHGSDRAARIVEGRSIIRPYVQAFLIGGELNFEEPAYSDYLIRQLRGAGEGGASGFTLWNNSNRYYMVTAPLHGFTGADRGAETGAESEEPPSLLN
ncbi:MAG: putative glycoside hydrolase [Spirochaetia bacterium]